MTDYQWSWIGDPVQVERKDPHKHYAAARRSGDDGSNRVFNVGDAVLTFDDDGTSMFAHIVDMYYKMPDDNRSNATTEQNRSPNPMFMCVVLRWFYDVDDVPNLKVPEGHLLFSDHVEPDGTNLLHVISAKAWLFPTIRRAKTFVCKPPPEYDSSADEVRTVSRYLDASDPALKSTRALHPGELELLLANPSRSPFFTNPMLPSSTSSSSEGEERRLKVKSRIKKKTHRTSRRPRVEGENLSEANAQGEESSHSSASLFQQPSLDSVSEEEGEMNIDEPEVHEHVDTPRTRRTRLSFSLQKTSSKPSLPSSTTGSHIVAPQQSHDLTPPADSSKHRRLHRRDKSQSDEGNNDDDSTQSLPASWQEPVLDEPKTTPRHRTKTSSGTCILKKRGSASRESSPPPAVGPIEFTFVAATPAPSPPIVLKAEKFPQTAGNRITANDGEICTAVEPPNKRRRTVPNLPTSQADTTADTVASALRSISRALGPSTTPSKRGPTTGPSPRGPSRVSMPFPSHSTKSTLIAPPIPSSLQRGSDMFSAQTRRDESLGETWIPFEPRRAATGAVFQPTAPRGSANTIGSRATQISPFPPEAPPQAHNLNAVTHDAGSGFISFESAQPATQYTAPLRATAVPVVNLRGVPRGVCTPADATNFASSQEATRRVNRTRNSAVPHVKAEPIINHVEAAVNRAALKKRSSNVVQGESSVHTKGSQMGRPPVPNRGLRSNEGTNLWTPTIPANGAYVNGDGAETDFGGGQPHANTNRHHVVHLKAHVKREVDTADQGYVARGAKEEALEISDPSLHILEASQSLGRIQPAETVPVDPYAAKKHELSRKEVVIDPDRGVLPDSNDNGDTHESFGIVSASAVGDKNGSVAGEGDRTVINGKKGAADSGGQDGREVRQDPAAGVCPGDNGNGDLRKLVHELNVLYTGFTKGQRDRLNILLGPFAHHVGAVLERYQNATSNESLSDAMAEQIVRQTLVEIGVFGQSAAKPQNVEDTNRMAAN